MGVLVQDVCWSLGALVLDDGLLVSEVRCLCIDVVVGVGVCVGVGRLSVRLAGAALTYRAEFGATVLLVLM